MTPSFITVIVDEHDEIPDGCCMRFKAVGAARVVRRLRLDGSAAESAESAESDWLVDSRDESGEVQPAYAVTVEDSSAGSSLLVYGGARGLRLASVDGRERVAEPYLLVAERAVIE